ncbi:hypothetical protein B9Z65_7921 [Elsinoe australis]|uniref:Uncharacterized protein n=1 Tax=Elsinoe australis TaxID=40998 RepID=A0A2P8A0Y7_9PEZI|nr:hypothetical protein B9Z65_7921 [Elsinoe australis]
MANGYVTPQPSSLHPTPSTAAPPTSPGSASPSSIAFTIRLSQIIRTPCRKAKEQSAREYASPYQAEAKAQARRRDGARSNTLLKAGCYPGRDRLTNVWRSSLILSAFFCYLMWLITFLAQWHPLIVPERSDLRPEFWKVEPPK